MALPDGVELRPDVPPHDLAVALVIYDRLCHLLQRLRLGQTVVEVAEYLHRIAFAGLELLLQEHRQVDLAHKADALRILFLGAGQTRLACDGPHFGLGKMTYREERPAQLLLIELAEKVALVLVAVGTRQQSVHCLAVGAGKLVLLAVVTRGHHVGAQPHGMVEEGVELDLAVAEDVGVGGAARLVLAEHVVHHPLAVFAAKVHKVERDADLLGHHAGHREFLLPLAVTVQGPRGVVPVLHEYGEHIGPLLLQKQGSHARIDPSGQTNCDFHESIFC